MTKGSQGKPCPSVLLPVSTLTMTPFLPLPSDQPRATRSARNLGSHWSLLGGGKAMTKVVLWVVRVGKQDGWEWEKVGCSHRTIYLKKGPIVLHKYSSSPRSRKTSSIEKASWLLMTWEKLLTVSYYVNIMLRYQVTAPFHKCQLCASCCPGDTGQDR